jgi:hypothetical protein
VAHPYSYLPAHDWLWGACAVARGSKRSCSSGRQAGRRRLRRAGFEVGRLSSGDRAYEAEIVVDVEALLSRSRVSSKRPRRASTSSARAM